MGDADSGPLSVCMFDAEQPGNPKCQYGDHCGGSFSRSLIGIRDISASAPRSVLGENELTVLKVVLITTAKSMARHLG